MLTSVWRSLPSATRVGLFVASPGVGADVIHHAVSAETTAGELLNIGFIGHVLTLAGMVLALSGVVRAAADSRRRARQEGDNDVARSGATVPR